MKGYSQETVAEIAVFILGLAPSTKVNANDSPSLRLDTRLQDPNHWLCVLYCQPAQSMTSIILLASAGYAEADNAGQHHLHKIAHH
jgi:hypothetical protein